MLREDFIVNAANIHISGARTMRDGAAALMMGCAYKDVEIAFSLCKCVADCENVLGLAAELGSGLICGTHVTKYTSVIEARMRLGGVEINSGLTQNQLAAERAKSVAPGTRGDIYDGYIRLSKEGARVADSYLAVSSAVAKNIQTGKMINSTPYAAIEFINRCVADYKVACQKLCAQEEACLIRRAAEFENYRKCLTLAAGANGVAASGASCDSLAAMAAGGLIPNVPPCLYDILLRYERMPAALGGEENTKSDLYCAVYNQPI